MSLEEPGKMKGKQKEAITERVEAVERAYSWAWRTTRCLLQIQGK